MTDRNEPLRLMDEIERNYGVRIPLSEWHHFRTTLEAQRDELAQLKAKNRQILADWGDELIRAARARKEIIAEKEARIARLEGAIYDYLHGGSVKVMRDIMQEENHESAAAIKAETARAIFDGVSQRIDEADQSGIAAYGKYSTEVWNGQQQFIDGMRAARLVAKAELDRIEREAKEQGDE